MQEGLKAHKMPHPQKNYCGKEEGNSLKIPEA